MRERDKLFKYLTKHNDYKRIRNIVVSKIKESKKQYHQNYFQRNSKNLKKKTRDGIKSVVTLKFKDKKSPNSLFADSNIIVNKSSIAQTFSNFFVNVSLNIASKIPKAKSPLCKYLKKEF